jgi:hypothetical protein
MPVAAPARNSIIVERCRTGLNKKLLRTAAAVAAAVQTMLALCRGGPAAVPPA